MSELPETVTEAPANGGRMIPLSEVEPLLEAVAWMIGHGQPMRAELLLSYDRAARAAAVRTSAGICAQKHQESWCRPDVVADPELQALFDSFLRASRDS